MGTPIFSPQNVSPDKQVQKSSALFGKYEAYTDDEPVFASQTITEFKPCISFVQNEGCATSVEKDPSFEKDNEVTEVYMMSGQSHKDILDPPVLKPKVEVFGPNLSKKESFIKQKEP